MLANCKKECRSFIHENFSRGYKEYVLGRGDLGAVSNSDVFVVKERTIEKVRSMILLSFGVCVFALLLFILLIQERGSIKLAFVGVITGVAALVFFGGVIEKYTVEIWNESNECMIIRESDEESKIIIFKGKNHEVYSEEFLKCYQVKDDGVAIETENGEVWFHNEHEEYKEVVQALRKNYVPLKYYF